MVQPEDGIKACVWNVAHVATVPHQTVDSVVYAFKGVIGRAATVGESCIGERCIVRLIGDQLIGRVVKVLGICLELQIS